MLPSLFLFCSVLSPPLRYLLVCTGVSLPLPFCRVVGWLNQPCSNFNLFEQPFDFHSTTSNFQLIPII